MKDNYFFTYPETDGIVDGVIPKYLMRSKYKAELERRKRQARADKAGLIAGVVLIGLGVAYFALHYYSYAQYVIRNA